MQVNITGGGKKIQLLYVLWVLENFSDREHTLKQDDIVAILEERGYHTERKSVARDLKLLFDFGYKIHGIEPELDEDGNELPMKRGAIWLEREFSDEQLSLLLNSVAYNVFVEKNNKEELLNNIIHLGSKTFKEKHNANSLINGGRIYQVEGTSLLNQLKVIEKAIEKEKRIRFKYASKLKRDGNNFIYQKDKEYVVSPYWVVSKNGNLYLVCFNHGENQIWNCRIDKIKEVEVIKSSATPKTDTELKDKSVGDYVSKHPNMFTGDPISIEFKVDKTRIGHVYETFSDVTIINETEDCLTVKVFCGELDMFYWAIQYGGLVEVLKPQSLREKIRIHIEGMTFKYKGGDGDRYSEAIKNAKRDNGLHLKGIDLTNRNEHLKLKNISRLYLHDNNLNNIDFIENYTRLGKVSIKNNSISDLSPLSKLSGLHEIELINLGNVENLSFLGDLKHLKRLILDFDRDVDLSKLNEVKGLDVLFLSERCSCNLSLDYNKIEKNNPKLIIEVFDRDFDKTKSILPKYMDEEFYKIILKIAFGFFVDFAGDEEEMKELVEKMIQKLPKEERDVIELFYREKSRNYYEVSEKLGKSIEEIKRLRRIALQKISHESYNENLKKFIIQD